MCVVSALFRRSPEKARADGENKRERRGGNKKGGNNKGGNKKEGAGTIDISRSF